MKYLSDVIHSCDWSSQPDIHIRCSGKWTTPAWSNSETEREGVYRDEEGDFYTFDDVEYEDDVTGEVVPAKVTCETCLAMIARDERYKRP
jgi:hypothetical protein